MWHLSPLLRGTTRCHFPVWLRKCSSDFNTELMPHVNWMFSRLTSKAKHRKQASHGLIGYIKHKLHGTISKVAERSCPKNITSSFDLFFKGQKSDQQKLKYDIHWILSHRHGKYFWRHFKNDKVCRESKKQYSPQDTWSRLKLSSDIWCIRHLVQKMSGPHQKVLEIRSYRKCPQAGVVHAKRFWMGRNIKDLLV